MLCGDHAIFSNDADNSEPGQQQSHNQREDPQDFDAGGLFMHYSSSAASCPQAPSISFPRVSRRVVGTPASLSRSINSWVTSGSDAVQTDPGVGFSGMGLICAQPRPRALIFLASRSARHAWSFISLINAYSMETRRPVSTK